jgi:hypothetical protein
MSLAPKRYDTDRDESNVRHVASDMALSGENRAIHSATGHNEPRE